MSLHDTDIADASEKWADLVEALAQAVAATAATLERDHDH